jgi:hypothetical protein
MKNIYRNSCILLFIMLAATINAIGQEASPSDSLIQAGAQRLLNRYENYAQLVERGTYTEASERNFLSLFDENALMILGLTPDGFSDKLLEPREFIAFAKENFPSGLIVQIKNRELIEINRTEQLVIYIANLEIGGLTKTQKWVADSFEYTFTISYNTEADQFLIMHILEKEIERISLDFEFRNVSRNNQPVKNLTVFLKWERGEFTEKTGDDGVVRFENVVPIEKKLTISYAGAGFKGDIKVKTAEEWLQDKRVINLTEKRFWTGWSFEGSLLPAYSGISTHFNNKNYSYSNISTSDGVNLNLSITGAYYFSQNKRINLAVKSGIEVFSAKADIAYGNIHQNQLNRTDAGNDDYLYLLTAKDINESVRLITLNIPILLDGRLKFNSNKIPFLYGEVGISFGFPVSFTSDLQGSYTSTGLYEQYNNLIIHSQPQLGFYTDRAFEMEQTQQFDPSLLTSLRAGAGLMINTGFPHTYLKTGIDFAMGINGTIEGNSESYYFLAPGNNPDSPLRSTDKFNVYWLSLKIGVVYDLFN